MSEVTTEELQELLTTISIEQEGEFNEKEWAQILLMRKLVNAELSWRAAVPADNFSEEIKQHVEMYAGVSADHHSHLGLLRRMHAALSAPSQPIYAPGTKKIGTLTTSLETGVTTYDPSQPSAADKPVADLSGFVGALDAGENGIITEMFTIDERLHGMHESNKSIPSLRRQREELEQHLSELQQLKQICEAGADKAPEPQKSKESTIKASNPMIAAALAKNEDATGLCTVREIASMMYRMALSKENPMPTHDGTPLPKLEMWFVDNGKRYNVEITVTKVEDAR